MKKYITPRLQMEQIEPEPPFATSGPKEKPGHGYGDKNHDHDGPPGHNKHDFVMDDDEYEYENLWEY